VPSARPAPRTRAGRAGAHRGAAPSGRRPSVARGPGTAARRARAGSMPVLRARPARPDRARSLRREARAASREFRSRRRTRRRPESTRAARTAAGERRSAARRTGRRRSLHEVHGRLGNGGLRPNRGADRFERAIGLVELGDSGGDVDRPGVAAEGRQCREGPVGRRAQMRRDARRRGDARRVEPLRLRPGRETRQGDAANVTRSALRVPVRGSMAARVYATVPSRSTYASAARPSAASISGTRSGTGTAPRASPRG